VNRDDLAARFAGELIWPDHASYDEARATFNQRQRTRPNLIARCIGNADVVAALQFARDEGLEVATRATGHSYAGLSATEGVVLDLSLMRGVRVDPQCRTARLQGGSRTGDIQTEAGLFGFGASTGALSTTGPGLILCGGSGFLRTRGGRSSDQILAADLVTAEGRLVRVSPDAEPDLLWALRGAGPSFGVVTSLDIQLYPVPPEVAGGTMYWREPRLEEGVRALREAAEHATEGLMMVNFLRFDDLHATLPEQFRGVPFFELTYCHVGSPEEAAADLGLIREAGRPDEEESYTSSFRDLHFWLVRNTARLSTDSYCVGELRDDVIALTCSVAREMGTPGAMHGIEFLDQRGALAREPALPSAQPRTPARAFSIRAQVMYTDPDEDREHDAWAGRLIRRLQDTGLGIEDVCIANTLSYRAAEERVRASFGAESYERLARLKHTWDPDNVFHHALPISPQSGA